VEQNVAKAKNGDNPESAAADGRGFINGVVFFWGKKPRRLLTIQYHRFMYLQAG
jgi:hypothetical protein